MKCLIATGLRLLFKLEDRLSWCINQLATRYDGGVHAKHRLMQYHDFFVDRVKPEERALDIGCGYGAVAYSVASRAGAWVTGIDLNANNIENARKRFRHSKLTFRQGDALTDLPADSYEVIILSNLLEHIEHREAFLRAVQQQLRPRRWLIRVPMINRDWRVFLRKELGLFYFSDRTHFTEYTQESFDAEMRRADFEVVHLQINWGEIWAEVRPHA